jgi:hypothetical protein
MEATWVRTTRVVLAAAHLDHDPRNNRLRNLRSLCQRCHLLHDRTHRLRQRRITYRRRDALGDLFLGPCLRAMPQAAVPGQVPVTQPIPPTAGARSSAA